MTATVTEVLSAQEAAIESGRATLHGSVTDRVLRMYEAVRSYGPPRVTLDRAVVFTESFKDTEGQPLVLRWAKALKLFAEKAPIAIFPDELIVGRPNAWLGRWAIVYPELDGSVMPSGVKMFRDNKGKPGEVIVTDEDERIINEVLTPYWTGKDYATNFLHALPEETRFMLMGPDPKNIIMYTCVVLATSPMRHSQNWTPDFSKILTRGVKGIREEAQSKLDALTDPRDIVYKTTFLQAVIMTCDAMTTWSRRFAGLAAELAAREANPQRKRELKRLPRYAGGFPRTRPVPSVKPCRRSGGDRCSTGSSRRQALWARGEWINTCCLSTRKIWPRVASPKNRRLNSSTASGWRCRRQWKSSSIPWPPPAPKVSPSSWTCASAVRPAMGRMRPTNYRT